MGVVIRYTVLRFPAITIAVGILDDPAFGQTCCLKALAPNDIVFAEVMCGGGDTDGDVCRKDSAVGADVGLSVKLDAAVADDLSGVHEAVALGCLCEGRVVGGLECDVEIVFAVLVIHRGVFAVDVGVIYAVAVDIAPPVEALKHQVAVGIVGLRELAALPRCIVHHVNVVNDLSLRKRRSGQQRECH